MKQLAFIFVSMAVLCLWSCDFNSSGSSSDTGFIQKGYVYRAHYTDRTAYYDNVPTDLVMTIYRDGSVELVETSNYDGRKESITYDCSLKNYYESSRDIAVSWWELKGYSSKKNQSTTLYIDLEGHGYIPWMRSGHEAVGSGKYDFTFTRSPL